MILQFLLPGNYFVVFFAVVFFAGAFFAAGFFAGVAFFAAGFLVAVFAGAFFAAAFSSFTPASLAVLARALFRRAAVFLVRMFFLTAVSISLCAADRVFADGFVKKALTAVFTLRFVATFRSRRTAVCFILLIADLMIGLFGGFS